jgi:hypothetical protein
MLKAERGGLFVTATADIDGCYRYGLSRTWGAGRRVLWIMLNPSTATAEQLDPTLRRCLRFSDGWGFKRMDICNLFAYRSTNPRELLKVDDPVGPRNDQAILEHARAADLIMCGWGIHGSLRGRNRVVSELLMEAGLQLFTLGVTEGGEPRHPLYLAADTVMQAWKG